MLKIDNYDRALIGIATVWQRHPEGGASQIDTLIYDGDILVEMLTEEGLTADEALEHISVNIVGAYVGESTPIIVWPCDMDRVNEVAEQNDE